MKKVLVAALGVTMALCLTACGNEQDSMGLKDADKVSGFDTSYNVEETVLVDENDVKITVTGLTYRDYDVVVNLIMENNSDKNLSFGSGMGSKSSSTANGYMFGGYLNTEVAPGQKVEDVLYYGYDELQLCGITKIADLQIGFSIRDDEEEGFDTGLRQVKTKAADSYDYSISTFAEGIKDGSIESTLGYEVECFAEDTIYEQNDVKLLSKALLINKNGEKEAFLEVVNDSEKTVFVHGFDISVNELIVGGRIGFNEMVYPGMRKVVPIYINELINAEYLELLGISEIGAVDMKLEITAEDDSIIAECQDLRVVYSEDAPMLVAEGTEVFNSEGVRIISKGLVEERAGDSEYVNMVLLLENTREETIFFDIREDSFSFNGHTMKYLLQAKDASPGKVAFAELSVTKEELQGNGIPSADYITEAEFAMEVMDATYHTVAESTVEISY